MLRFQDQRVYALMRHAKSDWQGNRADIDRPLKNIGKLDAKRAAQFLIDSNWLPTVIISSPAKRAVETINEIITILGSPKNGVLYQPELYLGSTSSIVNLLTLTDKEERPLLVGHNPAFEQWIKTTSNSSDYDPINHKAWMPTSCVTLLCIDSKSRLHKITKIWRKNDLQTKHQ